MGHQSCLGTLTTQRCWSGHIHAPLRMFNHYPFHHRLPKKGTAIERCDIDELGMKMELCRTTDDATASNAEHKKRRYQLGDTPTRLLSKEIAFFQFSSIREAHETTEYVLFSGVLNSHNAAKRKIPEGGIKVKTTVTISTLCAERKLFLHCYHPLYAFLACRDEERYLRRKLARK